MKKVIKFTSSLYQKEKIKESNEGIEGFQLRSLIPARVERKPLFWKS